MGSGKGGGPSINPSLAAEAYQNFSNYGTQGTDINAWPGYSSWATQNPSLVPYAQAGWAAGQQQRVAQQQAETLMSSMAEMFRPPEMSAGPSPEEIARQNAIRERDDLFGAYMDAANAATDYINQQIEQERSNANLMGIDYRMTDELKQQRINDYFATVWEESKDRKLKQLIKEYGNPEGFTGEWIVTRGTPSSDSGSTDKKSSEKSLVPGRKRKKPEESILPDNEKLGAKTILGV